MIKKIIEFRYFGDSDSFVKWQKTENVTITQVTPVPMKFNADGKANSTSGKIEEVLQGNIKIGAFVMYIKKGENND